VSCPDEPLDEPRVVVRDKRRIDPVTGEVREPAAAADVAAAPAHPGDQALDVTFDEVAPDGGVDAAEVSAEVVSADVVLQAQLAERTDDLLRLKAEFDNYRRRVERDRASWGEAAVAGVLASLLPALDDADRAEQHGELSGTFRTVVDTVVKALVAAGLERFGVAGEPFDPVRHEALTSVPSPGATGETVLEVYRAGYSHAARVLRPAQVVVGTPA